MVLYDHLDVAALLIRFNTEVNATDQLGFTPLHEAAQKGRTQLCALLLAHGADPHMKNQEGQTPLDLSTAEDVKCLLQDAMTQHLPPTATSSPLNSPVFNPSPRGSSIVTGASSSGNTTNAATNMAADTLVLPSGNAAVISAPCPSPPVGMNNSLSPLPLLVLGPDSPSGSALATQPAAIVSSGAQVGDGCSDSTAQELQSALATAAGSSSTSTTTTSASAIVSFLSSLGLEHLREIFEREQVTIDILL